MGQAHIANNFQPDTETCLIRTEVQADTDLWPWVYRYESDVFGTSLSPCMQDLIHT